MDACGTIGVIGHDCILVSLAEPHFIDHLIKESGRLSMNLVTEEMLLAVDVSGSVTGAMQREYELWAVEVNALSAENDTITTVGLAMALAHSLEKREQLLKLLAMNHYDMEEHSRPRTAYRVQCRLQCCAECCASLP